MKKKKSRISCLLLLNLLEVALDEPVVGVVVEAVGTAVSAAAAAALRRGLVVRRGDIFDITFCKKAIGKIE